MSGRGPAGDGRRSWSIGEHIARALGFVRRRRLSADARGLLLQIEEAEGAIDGGDLAGARERLRSLRAGLDRVRNLPVDVALDVTTRVAALHAQLGEAREGLPLARRAAELAAAAPPDSSGALSGAYLLAVVLAGNGLHAEALPLYERILSALAPELGDSHPDVLECRLRYGTALEQLARFAEASQVIERCIDGCERMAEPPRRTLIGALSLLGSIRGQLADYPAAESLLRRAIACGEAAPPGVEAELASALNNLGRIEQQRGRLAEARVLISRALELIERATGGRHLEVAKVLSNLAQVYRASGDYRRGEACYRKSLEIKESLLGPDHPSIATSLHNLARHEVDFSRYDRAEPLERRAIAILERAYGGEHPSLAPMVNQMALILKRTGNAPGAALLYQRALSIRERALGPSHPDLAVTLTNLGVLFVELNALRDAVRHLERALAIVEAAFGPEHLHVATILNNLKIAYGRLGERERELRCSRRAFAIRLAQLGERHPSTLLSMNNLTDDLRRAGEADAEALGARLAALVESLSDEELPNRWEFLDNLSCDAARRERWDEALRHLRANLERQEAVLRGVARIGTEERVTSYLYQLRFGEWAAHSLASREGATDEAVRFGLSVALLRKGRSVEESARLWRLIHHHADRDGLRAALDELNALRVEKADVLPVDGTATVPLALKRRIVELTRRIEELEQALADRLGSARAEAPLPGVDEIVGAVAARLPGAAALIEFVRYTPIRFAAGPGESVHGPRRFLAYVLRPGPRVWIFDLGVALSLESVAQAFVEEVADPPIDEEAWAQALPLGASRASLEANRAILEPLRTALAGCDTLLVSPDGELCRTPFPALHDGTSYLADRCRIAWLTSGRDLLRAAASPGGGDPVLFADPNFEADGAPDDDVPTPLATRMSDWPRPGRRLEALPGTRQELAHLRSMLPGASGFTGAAATRAALLGVRAPLILHIATHGLLLEEREEEPETWRIDDVERMGRESPPVVDPLLRSALALAGSNGAPSTPGTRPPGIVTAYELCRMNLTGTRLVVLSACLTAQGRVRAGQGVFGLQRAFLVAGAESVVGSLWRVQDEVTVVLMAAFYERLLDGAPVLEALRAAAMEARRVDPHPSAWAPFIAIGPGAITALDDEELRALRRGRGGAARAAVGSDPA